MRALLIILVIIACSSNMVTIYQLAKVKQECMEQLASASLEMERYLEGNREK